MYSHPDATNECWKKHLDRKRKKPLTIHSCLSAVAYSLLPLSVLILVNCSAEICPCVGC